MGSDMFMTAFPQVILQAKIWGEMYTLKMAFHWKLHTHPELHGGLFSSQDGPCPTAGS